MERKFLEGLGLQKDALEQVMAQHGRGIEAQKAKCAQLRGERETLAAQLGEAQKALAAFEGVDVDDLRQQVARLEGDLVQQRQAHERLMERRDFEDAVRAQLLGARAKNPRAVMALLDMEALAQSEDAGRDTAVALALLLESEPYLFEDGAATPARVDTGGAHAEPGGMEQDAFTAAALFGAGLAR